MTSKEMNDEPFSPRWLAANIGVSEVMRRRHEVRSEATGRNGVDEDLMPGLKGRSRAQFEALSAQLKSRWETRTDDEKRQATQRLRDIVAEGSGLGRAVYDAMTSPQDDRPH